MVFNFKAYMHACIIVLKLASEKAFSWTIFGQMMERQIFPHQL